MQLIPYHLRSHKTQFNMVFRSFNPSAPGKTLHSIPLRKGYFKKIVYHISQCYHTANIIHVIIRNNMKYLKM